MNVTIRHGALELQPSSHPDAGSVVVSFQRTLRIPDDGRTYPLPPGLGEFPLRSVRDYAHRVPTAWARRGGVMLPMYQREALWLCFGGAPHALKVGVGKVCAITGERWTDSLHADPQNYVVTGQQPWLDGIATGRGTIRQFVAMPLGMGYTIEGQVTGDEEHGGIQLQAFAPKPGRIPRAVSRAVDDFDCCEADCSLSGGEMGIAAGGTMEQKIYPDDYGLSTWDLAARARVFVHIVSSDMWRDITGEAPPPSPVSARTYSEAGLPWFSLYDEKSMTLAPTPALASIKSVKQIDVTKSKLPLQNDQPVATPHIKQLWKKGGRVVDDGEW